MNSSIDGNLPAVDPVEFHLDEDRRYAGLKAKLDDAYVHLYQNNQRRNCYISPRKVCRCARATKSREKCLEKPQRGVVQLYQRHGKISGQMHPPDKIRCPLSIVMPDGSFGLPLGWVPPWPTCKACSHFVSDEILPPSNWHFGTWWISLSMQFIANL